ncbi:MAG: DUF3445 domain-containing protein [Rhizobacter sp.]|nr:DUF3445 domain-containing protein [Burkholderiales bacterium]
MDWLTPATKMPWPVTVPFRMGPNLQKLDPVAPALLLRDELSGVYRRERELVIAAHPERAMVGNADDETLSAILGLAPSPAARERAGVRATFGTRQDDSASHQTAHPSPVLQTASAQACADRSGGGSQAIRNPASTPQGAREQNVALAIQEDFVILKQHQHTLRTEYLSVCFPSRWDPREKLGLDFAAIHAPVADNPMLLAAGPNIMTMAFVKQPMLRYVWLIVPAANLDQHPEKNQAWWSEALADPSPLLPRLFLRVERQTTWPLPHLQRAVFFIRLMMSPLTEVLRISALVRPERISAPVRPERSEGSDALVTRAAELAASLRSMTPAIVAYRGMTPALPRLLTELDTFK